MVSGLVRSTGVLRTAFENANVRRVEIAFAGFNVAEYGTWIAIMVNAYGVGGATAAGVIGALQLVPAAIFAPFASALGDRYRRDRVLVAGYVAQALAAGVAGIAMLLGAPLALVYALAAIAATSVTLTRPVQGAILPLLARTVEELTAANVASGWIEGFGLFAGPFMTGLLLAVSSPGMAFVVMGGVLLCSAFLSLGVSLGHAVMPPDGEGKEPNALTELLGGFQTIRREPEPRLVISLMATHFMLVGAMDVLFVILAFRFLAIGSAGVGYLNAAFGVGGLLGAAVTVTLIGRQRFAPPLLWGAMAWGIGLGLVGLAPNRLIGPLCIVLVGAGRPLVDVAGRTLLQRVVADQVLSRVFGVVEGLSMGAQGAGMVLVPALVALLSPRAALIALALILPAMAVLNWRRLNAIDIRTAVPIIRLTLLREVPFFAPLWPDIADTLAGHLILVERAAGSVIIQQGEAGDRFYIIAEGQVSVVKNGVQANVLGPAGFFGEIALLRDVPRTATVTALSDVQLYALEREPFLQSISGHQTSMREAEAVVRARMGESVEEAAIPPA